MDNKNKRWAFTAFEDQYRFVDELAKDDKFCKEIGWQDEIAPDTGRKHRQGYLICQAPQRFSAVKSRLPGVHLEPAKDIIALKKYCQKETSRDPEGGAIKATHPPTHVTVDVFMEKIANWVCDYLCDKFGNPPDQPTLQETKNEYWAAVNYILMFEPFLAHLAMMPGPILLWTKTRNTWLWRAKRARAMGNEGLVLPGVPPAERSEAGNIITLL